MLVNTIILGQIKTDDRICGPDASQESQDSFECITSKTYVASFGMASSTMGIILLAPGICYVLALSNNIPQAFGAKNYELCGAYMNRNIITVTAITLPLLIVIWVGIDYLFIALGQTKYVVQLSAIYLRIVAPGVVCYIWGQAHNMLAACQGKPRISLFSTAGASIFHWFVAWYLAINLDMKMTGIAIASSLHFVMRFAITVTLVRCDKDLARSIIPLSHPSSW